MRFLIVGLGSIGQRHVRNLRRLYGNDVEILAYRSRGLNVVIHDDMTAEFGIVPEERFLLRRCLSLKAALEERPEAVFITNPTSLHISTAITAAQAGSHLFIEKPISNNLSQIEELEAAVSRKNLTLLVGYQLRFHPALRKIAELIHQDRIGRMISARLEFGEYLPDTHPYENYEQGCAARKDLGGGVVLCFSHELDCVYWLFGMPRKVAAIGGHLSSLKMDAADVASILLECNQGSHAFPVHVHLDFLQKPARRRIEVLGEGGRILWDYYANELQVLSGNGEKEIENVAGFERNQLFLAELKHFARCLEGGERPVVSLKDGVASLKIALAATESMETGKVIELNP